MQPIQTTFSNLYKKAPAVVVQSPGRINLIGEHTDYNNGFVLPAAINKVVQVAIASRNDNKIHLHAIDLNETEVVDVTNIIPHAKHWVNYVIGVVAQVQQYIKAQSTNNIKINGFDICIQGDIPIGAGLSSSAAVECAVLFSLNELYTIGLSRMQMALMTQKAEHEFAGVQCGIMDMFASLHGKKNQVILLDCDSLTYQYYPLDLKEYSIVLLDTQIKHSLASSEYNKRRLECEEGLAIIQQQYPAVKTFRDITIQQVETCLSNHATIIYNRCKYVVEEIERVQKAVKDLLAGNLKAFGQKMFETHQGLSVLYEVSCPELDILVQAVSANENVLGARMMGGGFGGCTINIIKTDQVDQITAAVKKLYIEKTSRDLQMYKVSIEEGTHLI